jgi:glycine/D-amino acid oxidase-like deaminating enzyme
MDQNELRGGHAPWATTRSIARPLLEKDLRCEVLVVGAGITGALMAEHLSAQGRDVCLIDREKPGQGSTAASTAMLLWELDTTLGRLTELYGFERAAEMYRHSFRAVAGLARSVASLGLGSTFRERDSLYIASETTHARDLLAEQQLRVRAGLPSRFLDFRPLVRAYAVDREAAILSGGSAEADPLVLARSYVTVAKKHGAAFFDAEAVSYDSTKNGVAVGLDTGATIEAGYVVLATGYSLPEPVQSMHHTVSSTYAIATPPQPIVCWRDGVLIWEAQEDYLYARTTLDGRLIIGGEDDEIIEPAARDALIPAKTAKLLAKLHALCPAAAAVSADFAWAGTFGHTKDGLPLIGPVPGHPRLLAAYGYGGNGITSSFLASRVIERTIAGKREAWFDDYALDRPLL